MKNKQITGIIVAGVVFIFVGFFGILSNYLMGNFRSESSTASFNSMLNSFAEDSNINLPMTDYIGVVSIEGTIQPNAGSSYFSTSDGYNHDQNMKFVDKMMDSDNNKGIILYVDSPGGNVYETDELYLKLMEYKEQTERPVWAFFGSEACSGGYYISMAADKIYANRNCWTGSIGVIISLTNYKELLDKVGIKEIDITSGPNKAMGSGGLDMTQEQEEILQGMVDEAYDQFVGIVADGRNMDEAEVRKLADGRIYTAKQALEKGMIDSIGDYDTMRMDMEAETGAGDVIYYAPETDFSSLFSSLFAAYEGTRSKSDAQVVEELIRDNRNGVLMYYAK